MDERPDLEGTDYNARFGSEPDAPFAETGVYEEGITWTAPGAGAPGSYTGASNSPDTSTDETGAARSRIEQTRSELGQTVDAIQQKLSPGNLADEAKSAVQDATVGQVGQAVGTATNAVQQAASGVESTAAGVGSTVVETIKQNPVPAALAGVGLGWLIVSMRQQASKQPSRGSTPGGRNQGYPDSSNPYGWYYNQGAPTGYTGQGGYPGQGQQQSQGGLSGMADQAQSTVGQAVNQAQDTASQMASQAQGTASEMANQVQDTASQVANQAGQTMQTATTGLQRLMQERPLAVGIMAIGLGAAIGLAVPETEKEDEMMGSARQDLVQRAQQTAQQTFQKVETVAEHTIDAAKQEAKQEVKKQGL